MKRIVLILTIALTAFIGRAGNKSWTCIDENGNVQFQIDAIYVYPFSQGLARVYKNTLVNNQWVTGYGYINRKGEVVIPCNLDDAKNFESTVTWVKVKGQDFWQIMNQHGQIISSKPYSKVKNFYAKYQTLSAVYEDDKMGFVNQKGEEVIPCKYVGSSIFTEGLASVCLASSTSEKYGFINEKGEEIIPLKFAQSGSSSFEKGLARASVAGKTVLIDRKGETIFKTNNGNIQGHGFGLVLVITKPNRKGWGWVNFKDQFVIDPVYDYAMNFNEDGFAIVEKNGLKGVIDTSGRTILPLKYKTVYCDLTESGYFLGAYPTKETMSLADTPKDIFDSNLNKIPTDNIRFVMGANRGDRIIYSDQNKRMGSFDRSFNIIVPAKYEKFEPYSEGLAWVR